MHIHEKYLARLMFRSKVLASDATAFETLFTAVMTSAYPGFQQVKPQGSIGDRKNDGFDKSTGKYYQVFAPEDLRLSEKKALAKLDEDFLGLQKHWNPIAPIKEFSFVLNDKFKGAFPTVHEKLHELEVANSGIKFSPLLAQHLEDIFLGLTDENIIAIIGCVPDPNNIEQIDYSVLSEIVNELRAKLKPHVYAESYKVPDFSQKLEFNGLSSNVGRLLEVASYQAAEFEDLLSKSSDFVKDDIKKVLQDNYQEIQSRYGENSHGDEIFFSLLNCIDDQGSKARQDAALVLMAYYFEACDIFEEPIEALPSDPVAEGSA